MEAKASRNSGAVARRRVGFRARMAELASGASAVGNGAATTVPAGHPSAKIDRCLEATSAVALHRLSLRDGEQIDSVIVGPAGVTVVDTRHYDSKRATVSPTSGLRIGRRNRTDLIYELLAQVNELRELLSGTPYEGVPIEGAIVLGDVSGVPVIESFNAPRILTWGTRWIAHEASRPGPIPERTIESLAMLLEVELR
jgi:hypothetical protein